MECKNKHFYFLKGKNAAQAAKKSRAVYDEEALKDRQCQNWYDKFRSGDFSLKDEQPQVGQMKLMMTKSKP